MTTEYTLNFGLALPDFRSGPWHDLVNNDFALIDALLFSALSGVGVEPWANNTSYAAGVNALDEVDATIWLCTVSHTSAVSGTFAADRAAHPTYWTRLLTGFAPRGQWTNDTNYFPYDLVFDAARGIMALCSTKHTSNHSGNIKDDSLYWAFLIDMTTATLATAVAVTYSNSSSGIPATNVQMAIDYIQTEIVALNNVNVTQGNNITINANNIGSVPQSGGLPIKSLQTQINDLNTSIAALDSTNMKLVGNQLITGGFKVTSFSIGTPAGPVTPDPTKSNYQFLTNNGGFNLNAPTSDCAVDILVTNGASAGAISFIGFTVGPNIGDALTTAIASKFIISIRRINATSTYVVKALQ